jgi:uncharacterized protein (TIGR02594 family)
MSELLKIATSQLGIKEVSGNEDNPTILKYSSETGIAGVTHDEVAWCSIFVNWCSKKAGLQMTGKANARSWLNMGDKVTHPEPGDIVVFWRGSRESWKGHVGFFLGYNENASRVFCLGGNQGDSVSIQSYDVGKVLGYRRLSATEKLSIPQPLLKQRSAGVEVEKLQVLLNFLGFNCGDVDGDYGKKTTDALKLLQANHQLEINGIYDNAMRDFIEGLLQS